MVFKKAILLVDSKLASNKQAITQTVKAARTIKLLNRQGKTVAFQWVPSHVGIHGNETAELLAKKGATLQNKHTSPNFETIKRLIKQKNKKNSPRKPSPHPTRHSDKTSKLHGKRTKINPENKQSLTSGSIQATTLTAHLRCIKIFNHNYCTICKLKNTIMDKVHLLVCPQLNHTSNELPKLYWGLME
jgi:hypothetical protein